MAYPSRLAEKTAHHPTAGSREHHFLACAATAGLSGDLCDLWGVLWQRDIPRVALPVSRRGCGCAGSFTSIFQVALALGMLSRRQVAAAAEAYQLEANGGVRLSVGFRKATVTAAASVAECGDFHEGLAHLLLGRPTQVRADLPPHQCINACLCAHACMFGISLDYNALGSSASPDACLCVHACLCACMYDCDLHGSLGFRDLATECWTQDHERRRSVQTWCKHCAS